MTRVFLYGLMLLPVLLTACSNPLSMVAEFVLSPFTLVSEGYESAMDERSLGSQVNDAGIRASIRSRLESDAFLDGMNVSIYSYDGLVYLMGDVSPQTRGAAVEAARHTSGVQRVVTHWFLQESGDMVNDLAIGARLRAEMIADTSLSSTQIDTYTCGGNVLLLGMVASPDDEHRALQVARTVSGVRSVKSYLIF